MTRLTILLPGQVPNYSDALIAIGKAEHADYARRYAAWVQAGKPRSSDHTDTPHPTRDPDMAALPHTARGAIEHDVERILRGDDIRASSIYQRDYVDRYLHRRKPVQSKPKRLRDSQRSKVYAAERVAFPGFGGTGSEARFRAVADIEAYLDKIISSAWWRRRYPKVRTVQIKDGRGTTFARGGYNPDGTGTLNLPMWARNEPVILHELAHVATDSIHGPRGTPPHGREFCSTFLGLVRWQMGEQAWRALKDAFREGKVKHTLAPRTREMTDEQREAARERLMAARKAQTPGKD